ncbi:MAG: hypothetical protein Kow00124_00480 [Anaerolineae bacterium]
MADHLEELDQILAECLAQIEAGQKTVAECLAAYPRYRAELETALEVALVMRRARTIQPGAAFRQSATARLMARLPASPRPPAVPRGALKRASPPGRLFRAIRFSPAAAALSGIAAVLALAALLVAGANAAAPGDALYGIDQAVEQARLDLTHETGAAVELQLLFASERLLEAEALALQGRSDDLQAALARYGELIGAAAHEIAGVEDDALVELFSSTLSEQEQQLDAIFETAQEAPADDQQPEAGVDYCVGAAPHPAAQALADQYGVGYDQIMEWFCSGSGFGEIVLALNLGAGTGIPPAEVLEMRETQGGWGQIKQVLRRGEDGEADHTDDTGKPEDTPGRGPDTSPGGGRPDVPPGQEDRDRQNENNRPDMPPGQEGRATPAPGKPDDTPGRGPNNDER